MDYATVSRIVILFCTGAVLALALNLVQVWRFEFPSWPLVPLLACGATGIGMLYPWATQHLAEEVPDISKVMRCVAVFVGIYQASTKIEFSSSLELVVTMGALAFGMWWLFDRTREGLLLSVSYTLLTTSLAHVLLSWASVSSLQLSSMSWRLLCVYFCGCILFGAIGRRLSAID